LNTSDETIEIPGQEPKWGLFEKASFRFFFVYFIFIIVFENNGAFPFWYKVDEFLLPLTDIFVWIGKNIIGITWKIQTVGNGSGDTTFDFIKYFTGLSLASLAAVLWSVLDRKRSSYGKLYYYLTVVIRYYVAFMLFMYGLVKVFKTQFPDPDLYRLSEPYGNSTPMGLAWTYFGFSHGFNWFVGIAEISALLLLFRRTATFGAILTLITCLNILAVNLFFDVPVKLMSITLVMMCAFLLAGDAKRLFIFFFSGQTISLPKITPPVFKRKWMRISKGLFKFLLIGYAVAWETYLVYDMLDQKDVPRTKLYGVYEINEYEFIRDSLSAKNSNVFPWKQVVIVDFNRITVRMMDDSTGRYKLRIFVPDSSITFVPADPKLEDFKEKFRYNMNDSANIILSGRMKGDSVRFVLHRIASSDTAYTLRNTGFHWISDKPDNR
jgi:hypothetical protein